MGFERKMCGERQMDRNAEKREMEVNKKRKSEMEIERERGKRKSLER